MHAKLLLAMVMVGAGVLPLALGGGADATATALADGRNAESITFEERPDALLADGSIDLVEKVGDFELILNVFKVDAVGSVAVEADGEITHWLPVLYLMVGSRSQQISLTNQLPNGPMSEEEWAATFGSLSPPTHGLRGGAIVSDSSDPPIPGVRGWKIWRIEIVRHIVKYDDGSWSVRIIIRYVNEEGDSIVIFDSGFVRFDLASTDPGSSPGDPGRDDTPPVEAWMEAWAEIADTLEEIGGPEALAALGEIVDDMWAQLGEELASMGLPCPVVPPGD